MGAPSTAALQDRTILSLDDLRLIALKSSAVIEDTSFDAALTDILESVTERIEDYVGRSLIVRQADVYRRQLFWAVDRDVEATGGADKTFYSAYLPFFPVVELTAVLPAAIGLANINIWDDSRRIYADIDHLTEGDNWIEHLTYFAGYRRAGQTLAGLQAHSDLAALTVEPPVLPGIIRHVALRLTLHEVLSISSGLVGIGTVVQQVATSTLNLTAPEPGFERRELSRLDAHVQWV